MTTQAPKLGAHEIRSRFLKFFAANDHTVVKSSPLVPQNDPTLLFVNAGMVQFKDVFTGRETRDYVRAASSQRCLRAGGKHNDLDNVGFTPRHHTMFEMLGNFSFGDYFKPDAINWAWEFLTGELGISKDRLVVSIYNGEGKDAPYDQEAFDLWAELVPRDRIYPLHDKENFWQMGDNGPCGPCSEIHIYHGDVAPGDAQREGKFGPGYEDDKYTELWNLVFMQYELENDKIVGKLPKPSIDTGAGLERLATVLAGVDNNYETELLSPIVARAKAAVGPNAESFGQAPYQVIADHARAAAFLIADGVFPDKTGRSYVLRRIMRRAIRFGHQIGLEELFMHDMCREVVDRFAEPYPELVAAKATIEEVVKTEESAFRRTLSRGLKMVQVVLDELPKDEKEFPVAAAGQLYDTHGFPIDLTGVIAKEHELTLDEGAVDAWIKEAQGKGESFKGQGDAVGDLYYEVEAKLDLKAFRFSGYEQVDDSATVWGIIKDGAQAETAAVGEEVEVMLDRTPLYAESGGQMGDAGSLESEGLFVELLDTHKPTGNVHVHRARVREGALRVGAKVRVRVDVERRDAIRRNHSATHLLHHALRAVLGEHVTQKGSLVAPDRLRFDFSHGKGLSEAQRREIEDRVNREIWANEAAQTREMSLDDAKASGAMGLFGEKYDDEVRVVSIGRESVELCGGTHVRRVGDIGAFSITSEGGIAQGVRRIEAVTGLGALRHFQGLASIVAGAASQLHAGAGDEVEEKLARLLADQKDKIREISDLKRKLAAGGGASSDEVAEVSGVKLLVKQVGEADPKTMRAAADTLRDRIKSGVVVLAGSREGKASLLVGVTKDLTDRVHAGKLVGVLAVHLEGRGGGRPEMAQAGGPKVAGIADALAAAPAALAAQLG
jgi:alanyl-tRNA synthetase